MQLPEMNETQRTAFNAKDPDTRLKALLDKDPILQRTYPKITVPSWVVTLSEQSKIINHNNSTADEEIAVDPAIAAKRISVFGMEYCTPSKIVQSISALYGLRILDHTDKVTNRSQLLLTMPTVRIQTEPELLDKEIERIIPLPLRRWIMTTDPSIQQSAEWTSEKAKRAQALYLAAIGRLRILTDAAISRSKTKRVPISEMPEPTRDLIGLSSAATLMDTLFALQSPLPELLQNFDKANVQLKVTRPVTPGAQTTVNYTIVGPGGGKSGFVTY